MSTTLRAVWYTKSMTDYTPRGCVHATDDECVTLCGKRLVDNGMWWFGGWPATDANAVITCAKCKRPILTHNASLSGAPLLGASDRSDS